MLDFLFREAAKNPALANNARRLRQKIAPLIADGGYSLADKEGGAGPALRRTPVLLHAAKRLSDPFGIVLDRLFIARIKFSADQARYVKEREWPSDTEIVDHPDGTITLSLETAGTFELKRWVMSYGADAELLEPASLRSEIAAEFTMAAACYADNPGGNDGIIITAVNPLAR